MCWCWSMIVTDVLHLLREARIVRTAYRLTWDCHRLLAPSPSPYSAMHICAQIGASIDPLLCTNNLVFGPQVARNADGAVHLGLRAFLIGCLRRCSLLTPLPSQYSAFHVCAEISVSVDPLLCAHSVVFDPQVVRNAKRTIRASQLPLANVRRHDIPSHEQGVHNLEAAPI